MTCAGTPVCCSTRASSWRCSARNWRPPSIRAWLMNIGRYSCHGLTRSAGRDIALMMAGLICAWARPACSTAGSSRCAAAASAMKRSRCCSRLRCAQSSTGGNAWADSGAASAGVVEVAGTGATARVTGAGACWSPVAQATRDSDARQARARNFMSSRLAAAGANRTPQTRRPVPPENNELPVASPIPSGRNRQLTVDSSAGQRLPTPPASTIGRAPGAASDPYLNCAFT